MGNFFDSKPYFKSHTFRASLIGGIIGAIRLFMGIKSGDNSEMTEGASQMIGFYGLWRLRRGFWTEIDK